MNKDGGWEKLVTLRPSDKRIIERLVLKRVFSRKGIIGDVPRIYGLQNPNYYEPEIIMGGKQRRAVKARSILCYWGTRELWMSAVRISKN